MKHENGETFTEQTKVSPQGLIVRKPDGTLGTVASNNNSVQPASLLNSTREVQGFEYDDPDRHVLKRVT